jgi:hypothetical protein
MRLSGPYTDQGRLDAGNLAVNFRLLRLIPTLPDPYVANISLGRERESPRLLGNADHFVTAQVSWQASEKPLLTFEVWSTEGGRFVNPAQVLGPPARPGEFGRRISGVLPEEDAQRIAAPDNTFVKLPLTVITSVCRCSSNADSSASDTRFRAAERCVRSTAAGLAGLTSSRRDNG